MSTTSHKPIDEWNLDGALKELEKFHSTMDDRQFAFILGAGASATSGIPTGHALAQQWLEEIHQRECLDKELDLHAWLNSEQSGWRAKEISKEDAGSHYPTIFERRFKGDREAGYAALETAMEGKFPSLGYSLLACIIHHTRHKVVITTNFDNLVADALSMQAHQSPLIVAHESLAGFVRPKLRRPLIAKIHRDLFLNPINDESGVSTMEDSWKIALKKLFQYFTPIVIGYGGNDGSLMNMLKDLNTDEIAGRMFWCYRGNKKDISEKVLEVLSKHNGILVEIPSFDELMIQLAHKLLPNFSIDAIPKDLKALGVKRADLYRKQIEKLTKETLLDKNTTTAFKDSVSRGNSWWAWQLKANEEQDPVKRDAIYQEGIKEFPTSGGLCCNYAIFLEEFNNDYDAADKFYRRAIEVDSADINHLSNYAIFLSAIRKDYDAANSMYKSALELDPTNANITSNYAYFLAEQYKDYEGAEKMYQLALELDPTTASTFSNYALFLDNHRKDYNTAEILYKRALELDPADANTMSNYAVLLDNHGNHNAAEIMHKKALELAPMDIGFLANYISHILHNLNSHSAMLATKLAMQVIELSKCEPSQELCEALLYGAIAHELFPKECNKNMLSYIKYLLAHNFSRIDWSFEFLINSFSEINKEFYRAIGDAILNKNKIDALNKLKEWQELVAINPFTNDEF